MAGELSTPAASGADAPPSTAPEASAPDTTPVEPDNSGASEISEQEPEVTADTFGWDEWDGSPDSLPEPHRPWAKRLAERYSKESEAARAEAENARRVYEAIMEGREDPRLAQYKRDLEEAKSWKQKHEEAVVAHERFQKEVNAYFEAQARAAVDAFKEQNAWIFESPELQQLGYDLLEDGFGQNDLPHLLRMSDKQLTRVRDIMKDLSSRGAKNAGEYAIKLAVSEFRTPEPSRSAAIVAGSNPGQERNPTTVQQPPDVNESSLADLTRSSLAKNLRMIRR